MSDRAAVSGAIDSGQLLHPAGSELNLVGLSRALAWLNGVRGSDPDAGSRRIAAKVGENSHCVFVLIDGLGLTSLELLPASSFLRQHLSLVLQTVFPSATTSALTSLATGSWPSAHGVPGWFTYLPNRGWSLVPLPYNDRLTGNPIDTQELPQHEVFCSGALLPLYRSRVASVLPGGQINSSSNQFFRGETASFPYKSLDEAVDLVIQHVLAGSGPSFTYLYYPGVDALAHSHGPSHAAHVSELRAVDEAMRQLRDSMPASARLVVSADHGCVDISPAQSKSFAGADALLDCVVVSPTGEGRVTHYHLRPGRERDFQLEFNRRFGDEFWLLTREDAMELHLFGPGTPGQALLSRIGDFIAIGVGSREVLPAGWKAMAGGHGGLTPEEMLIPLIVA